MVSSAPWSADIWRASTLPSSEMLLMSPRSQRKSRARDAGHAVVALLGAWAASSGCVIMNTVGSMSGRHHVVAQARRRA